jgi:hypothetical protein
VFFLVFFIIFLFSQNKTLSNMRKMNRYIFAQYEELFFPFSFWAFEKKIRQLLDVFPSTFGKTSINWLLDVFLGGILGHVQRRL